MGSDRRTRAAGPRQTPHRYLRSLGCAGLFALLSCAMVMTAPASLCAQETHARSDLAEQDVAQLLGEAGELRAGQTAATQSLQVLPKSPELYLAAVDALQHQGKEYAARQLLVQGLSATASLDLLSRLAAVQDTHGEGAADLYRRLADTPQFAEDKRFATLKRGFEVALRDGDLEQARRFARLLDGGTNPEFQSIIGEHVHSGSETLIHGGREGLAFIALGKKGVSPQKFLAEFARALLSNVCSGICFGADEYKAGLQRYFGTVSQLQSMGTRDHYRVSITVSLQNQDERRRTEMVLNLLGLELHQDNGAVRLQEGVKRGQARKQDILAALGIDVIGMEKALQSGKPYTLEIDDDLAEIYPNAELWKQAFPGRMDTGFPEMLLHSPQLARLYLSLSEIEPQTLDALLGAVSPSELAAKLAPELSRFGPAFAVNGTQAVVPGGPGAVPVWKELAGTSPDQPGLFFRSLLENPPLLAYFYAVSELDARHQAFFTANFDRAQRFYTLSKSLTAARTYHKDLSADSSFSRFMRSLPIGEDGHVMFPGSPGVWLVAKGRTSDDKHISILAQKASQAVPLDFEDSILSHLAETSYQIQGLKNTELDNFLAVARLNAHLKEPMNEESALLLAQHYVECWPLYTYFTDLPDINEIGLRNYFSVIDQIRQKPRLIQNVEMGQLYALLGWVSILGRRQALSDDKVTAMFSQVGETMQNAVGRAQISAASLGLAKSIVDACGSNPESDLDDSVRQCMLGNAAQSEDPRAEDFQRVLELQRAPSLQGLKSIADAAQHILSTPARPGEEQRDSLADILRADARQIGAAASHLSKVEFTRSGHIGLREKEAIQLYDPAEIRKHAAALNQIAQKPNPSLEAARKVVQEVLSAILPQVTAALAAPIYAYYLRSTDLIVSDDPLLLRKHRYVDFLAPFGIAEVIDAPDFLPSSEGAGSHFVGGFASFALIAGRAATPGFRQGGHGAETMIAAQLAAIRSVPWERLTEEDQRLANLRILAAREWIVRSASDPEYFAALSSATAGLLSLARRADLLNSIHSRDWNTVWKSVPLPDLYMIGSEFSHYSLAQADSSPVFMELHALESSGHGIDINYFGHIPFESHGCGRLHLSADAPYEEYARHLMEEDLAERTADFNLYLAHRADNLGVEPAALARVAEKLAAKAFAASQLTDYHDWRSLFAAYNSITTNDVRQALQP